MASKALGHAVADALWAARALDPRPPPRRPTLVVLAGVPLSGKSTLARALAAGATTATRHIENDAVRVHVARAMGRAAPVHDGAEHFATHLAAFRLAALGLGEANVVLDGTFLRDSGRRGAYAAADGAGAAVVVVFVATEEGVVRARAAQSDEDRRRAHARLGSAPPALQASRPWVVVDGAAPAEQGLARLRAAEALGGLFAGSEG